MRLVTIFKLTIPVLMGYIPTGIAFGILAKQMLIPWYDVFLMSLFIYSGAGQFLLLSLFSSLSGFLEIAFFLLLINLRHTFYGLSMIERFANTGLAKPYLIFGMTDETYALIQTMPRFNVMHKKTVYLLVTALNHFYWILGVMLGVFIGNVININYQGIEFALTALFVVLSIDIYKQSPNKILLLSSLLIGAFAMLFVPSSQMLVVSLFVSLLFILTFKRFL